MNDLHQPYPILEFDPAREAIIEPSRIIKPIDAPEHCVICFFREVIEKLVADGQARVIAIERSEMGEHPLYELAVAGRRLATVENGPLAAGLYQRAWDMSGATKGLYFVRLRAGAVTLTKTVVKIR